MTNERNPRELFHLSSVGQRDANCFICTTPRNCEYRLETVSKVSEAIGRGFTPSELTTNGGWCSNGRAGMHSTSRSLITTD